VEIIPAGNSLIEITNTDKNKGRKEEERRKIVPLSSLLISY